MTNRLRFRLDPYPEESLIGFLVRLVGKNLHQDPVHILRKAGIKSYKISSIGMTDIDFETLAASVGLSAAELRHRSYASVTAHRKPEFFGHPLDRDLITCNRRQGCPACLNESPFHRAIWDIPLIRVCPKHCSLLIDTCYACNRRLQWRAPLTKCGHCGADLLMADTIAVPKTKLGGTREVYRLLGMPFGDNAFHHPLPMAASSLALIKLMASLGWFLHRGVGRPRPSVMVTNRDSYLWLNEGYEACVGWPGSFHDYLDRLRANVADRPGRYGLAKEFGPFVEWLVKVAPEDIVPTVQIAIDDYLADRPMLATPRGKFHVPRTLMEARTLTTKQASDLLGCQEVLTKNVLLRHGLLHTPYGSGSGTPMFVERKVVEELADALGDLIGKQELAKEFACSPADARSIANSNLLTKTPPGPLLELFARPAAWRRSEAQTLLKTMEKKASTTAADARELRKAFCMARKHGQTAATIISAIISGKVRITGIDSNERGFKKFFVDAADLDALMLPPKPKNDTVGLVEAAKILQLKTDVVYQLAGAGLISLSPHKRFRRVSFDELARFSAEFVPGNRLGSTRDCHQRWPAEWLIANGVRPVTGPSVDGLRQYFFRREEVEAVADRYGVPVLGGPPAAPKSTVLDVQAGMRFDSPAGGRPR